MTMLIKRLLAGVAFSAVAWIADDASAAFVCEVYHQPGSTTAGNEGHISLKTSTSANCGGVISSAFFFCSPGATEFVCVQGSLSRYNRSDLNALLQSLQRAAAADQVVTVRTGTCIGGNPNCAVEVTFKAN